MELVIAILPEIRNPGNVTASWANKPHLHYTIRRILFRLSLCVFMYGCEDGMFVLNRTFLAFSILTDVTFL